MESNHFLSLPIQDSTQTAEARRMAAGMARQAGFSEEEAGKVSIVLTEAATNLLKHAGGGELLLRPTERYSIPGIEMLALDKGPGMANVQECIRDGYSTAGSPGTGLGAIARQASVWDVYSLPGKGTALFMQSWASPLPKSAVHYPLESGAVAVPIRGESLCGDGWSVRHGISGASLLIADGLGHGKPASDASTEARRLFDQQPCPPAEMLKIIHAGLRSTRGAAIAVADADHTGLVRYAGIGNTTGAVAIYGGNRSMVSHNGTAGHQAPKIQEFSYDWPQNTVLVFATDGLLSQWSLDAYPGITRRHPTLIAAVLYRDFNRGRDDVTVVVLKRVNT